MMNLKQKVREEILKEERKKPKREYEYGCVMIYLDVDTKKWDEIQDMVDDDDIYNGEGERAGGYGRELDPHTTILYGIHADVPDKDVEKKIEEIKKPKIDLNKVSIFENKLFDVLKFDVSSDDLHKLNKNFKELPHTTEYPNYHPHITICYLKPSLGKKYMEKLSKLSLADIKSNKIVYSKPDNTKKEYPI